jgi:uncharacterized protein (DUF1330 family)
MTASAIAHSKFVDRAAYDRYQTQFLGAFAQFKGTLQVADEHSEVVDGETDVNKVVLMSFPDRVTVSASAESSDYTIASRVGGLPDCYPNLCMCNDSHEELAAQH